MSARLDAVAAALQRQLPDAVEREASSADLTTYRVGGPIGVLVRARRFEDLVATAQVAARHDIEFLVVGRGSNLLIADSGFDGVAIVLEGDFERLEMVGESEIIAGGSVSLPVLARRAAAAGIGGLEFYVGIPGSVGGAVRMNAGGHGASTEDVLVSARVFDLRNAEVMRRGVDDLDLGYRSSALSPDDVVVDARFAGHPDDRDACEARLGEIVKWRREHQPGGANAGSIFANPQDVAAGRLIDECGLKGLRVGGASVSTKHANFIQAEPHATASDVYELVKDVRARVEAATGVRLRPELRLVGFPPEEM